MYSQILDIATDHGLRGAEWIAVGTTLITILLLAAVLLTALHRFAFPLAEKLARRTRTDWDELCIRCGVLRFMAWLGTGILVYALARAWLLPASSARHLLQLAANLWMLTAAVCLVHALLNAIHQIYQRFPFARQVPIRVFVQVAKIVVSIVGVIMAVAMLMDRSPALLVSGMGAMTAILMLVFKDPILGFMAGIQLSANQMLAVGDWLEMPKYNADGDVIDITLTTVKVSNWDRTITTIPTYALISDAFKNWRGMTEAGGRRIKRSIFIDMTSIRFLTPDDIEQLRQTQLITQYVSDKLEEIETDNRAKGIDPGSPANGRRLTNIGTFRAYLVAYLRQHPLIHQEMIMIVRQLQPTPQGLPLEIYAFAHETAWVAYEGIQSDVFDHILAVVPAFGLRLFQTPSGADIQKALSAGIRQETPRED